MATTIGTVTPRAGWAITSFPAVAGILLVLTLVRIVGLQFSTVDLFFDEAQYWAWSQELAAGYFSKPPLLAWTIATANAVCGTGEACTRIASPLFHLASCFGVYFTALDLYDERTAGWSALAFALGTGLVFSARIISTDVPLIFFWTIALLAYVKLLKGPDWRWAIVFGGALGFGMLAKYAMVYFILCAVCACFIDRNARIFWTRGQTWAAIGIAAVLLLPNISWNMANDLATFRHTGDNIGASSFKFAPTHAAEFLLSQLAVAGPLVFAAFLFVLVRARHEVRGSADRLMLAFALPPLAIIFALSFFRSAHANWAATAIPSLTILVVAWWLRSGYWRWIVATLAIGIVTQFILLVADAYAYRITIPQLGRKSDVYERTLGWRGLGEQAAQLAQRERTPTVVAEGRAEMAALVYYLRDAPVRTVSWSASRIPEHHFDLTRAFDSTAVEPILFVSACPDTKRLREFFGSVTALGPFTVATGPTTERTHYAFRLANRRAAITPLGPCTADSQ